MTTPKHTPGPWRSYNVSRNKILKQWRIQRDDCRHDIALVSLDVPVDDRERIANLIAAAPVMYEALRMLTSEINLSTLNVRKDFSLMNAHACAVKAILQAEGKLL